MSKDKVILGFETSCDETAIAIMRGEELLVNTISSQVDIHEKFGGVVPEVASRAHAEMIRNIFHSSLNSANLQISDIDSVATTDGPGLVGSLVVGYNFAKSIAWSIDKPLYTVDHMVGHLAAPLIENPNMEPPFLTLLVSGGHTQIVLVEKWGDYKLMGTTIDDAAGEAFDKLYRFCGFGFPGGPAIQRIAESGNPSKINLPRPKTKHEYNYSFSGLKTAATNFLKNISGGGGVMANSRLREKMNILANDNNLEIFLPSPRLSTDNAAMICVAAQNDLITNDLKENDVRLSSIIK